MARLLIGARIGPGRHASAAARATFCGVRPELLRFTAQQNLTCFALTFAAQPSTMNERALTLDMRNDVGLLDAFVGRNAERLCAGREFWLRSLCWMTMLIIDDYAAWTEPDARR